MNVNTQNLLQFYTNQNNLPSINYSFSFVSLITPHNITNIRLLNNATSPFNSNNTKNIFANQSYLLMTWLWYIQSNHSSTSNPSFAFNPTSVHNTTLINSPMAHNTFSQEQFQFKFFNLVISFSIPFPTNINFSGVNQLAYLILSLNTSIPFVETNFFLLNRFKIILPSKDLMFLNL